MPLEASVTALDRGSSGRCWLLILREAKRERATNLEQVAAIVEHTDNAVYSRSPEGRVTSWNVAAERMFGYSAQEMVGQSSLVLEPKGRAGEFERLVDEFSPEGWCDSFRPSAGGKMAASSMFR